jgi:low affinity Fe/Cu permease
MDPLSALRNGVSSATSLLVRAAGSVTAIVVAVAFVVGYVAWGWIEGFTPQWHAFLYVVTGVTAFIMVFLIAHAQGRESRATLLKLDELVAATTGASDAVVAVEQEPIEHQEHLEDRAPLGESDLEESLGDLTSDEPLDVGRETT